MSEAESVALGVRATRSLDFRTIFDKHALFVMRTLRKLGVPSADAHDLCQETFVVVHRRLHVAAGVEADLELLDQSLVLGMREADRDEHEVGGHLVLGARNGPQIARSPQARPS